MRKHILNKPTTLLEIQNLEEVIGQKLPKSFIDYLLTHNEQEPFSDILIGEMFLSSTKQIIIDWQVWKDLLNEGGFDEYQVISDREIQSTWWDKAWIPFANDGRGNHLCLDLNPSPFGHVGQVIQTWHDDSKRKLIASSFENWLSNLI